MADTLESIELPLLPLRDVVVYPHMVIPLFVGRDKSIRALEAAMAADKQVLLVAQKSASVDEPGRDDVYRTGTVSNILQLLRLPDGTVKVLVEGSYRAKLDNRLSCVKQKRWFARRSRNSKNTSISVKKFLQKF
jgi:ATP-dependent Lon protease